MLRGYEDLISKRLSQCSTPESYFSELTDVLERVVQSKKQSQLPSTKFYKKIISEIDEIGWDKVYDMNTELSSIAISIK